MKTIISCMFLLLVSIMTWGQVNPFSSHEPIPENHITDKNIQIGALQFIDIKSNGTCHRSILSSNDFNNNSRYIACIINDSEAMDFVLELDNYLIDSIKIYKKDRDAEIELSTFSENSKDSKPLVHFPLAKDSSINIIVEIWNRPPFSIPVKLWKYDKHLKAQSNRDLFLGIGFGIFILIFIFSLVAFVVFKESPYLYYGLYVFFTYLFYFTEYGYLNNFGFRSLAFSERFIFSVVTLSGFSFLLFCYKLFKVKVDAFNLVYKILGAVSILVLIMINSPLIDSSLFFKFIYNAFILIFLLIFIISLFRVVLSDLQAIKTKYVIAFSYILLIVAVIVKPISFLGVTEYGFIAKYGSIIAQNIELLVLAGFLFSLQFKASNYTSELERKKLHYQNAALQAQMNPHFIFNSLNSIQSFIMSNEKENAMEYLTKFAKLIRQTLKSSAESRISILDEIQSLTNYLELEKLRIDNRFEYEITSSTADLKPETMIPPMLIQPFVENAVIHGMKSKKKDGFIKITFEYKTPFIEVVIFDNGRYIHPTDLKNHKSLGTDITSARLSIVNNEDFHVIPEINETGTSVRIKIRSL